MRSSFCTVVAAAVEHVLTCLMLLPMPELMNAIVGDVGTCLISVRYTARIVVLVLLVPAAAVAAISPSHHRAPRPNEKLHTVS